MCLGIPGQVVEIRDPVHHVGVVSVEGVRREVSLALLCGDAEFSHDAEFSSDPGESGEAHSADDAGGCVPPGTWVLVHVGFAMARIDEQEAAQTLAALRALGDVYASELSDLSRSTPLDDVTALDHAEVRQL